MQIYNVKIALQTVDYERRGGEGNNTQRFSCFHHSSQKCKSVLHVILSLEQWKNSSIYLTEAITSGEIGKQSFSYTGFIFFANEY